MAKRTKPKPSKIAVAPQDYLSGLLSLRKSGDPPDYATLEAARFGDVSERISTGSLALDKLTGGGWPVGRITEIAAWEGVGKSTLMDQAAAQCQRLGGIAVLVDSERGRDIEYTKSLGVDTGALILADADDIEESFERIDEVIALQDAKRLELEKQKKKPPPLLILWDSLGGTPARAELEGAPDDAHVSPAARVINMNMKRIVGRIAQNRITMVFANHFYKTIGGMGQLVAYGGKGPRYYTSLRLWLTRTGALKVGENEVGHSIKAALRKTRVGPPRPPETLGLVHGAGIDNAYTLFEWGKTHGVADGHKWVENRGRFNYLVVPGQPESIVFERSFVGLGALLAEKPDIYAQLAGAYLAEAE